MFSFPHGKSVATFPVPTEQLLWYLWKVTVQLKKFYTFGQWGLNRSNCTYVLEGVGPLKGMRACLRSDRVARQPRDWIEDAMLGKEPERVPSLNGAAGIHAITGTGLARLDLHAV